MTKADYRRSTEEIGPASFFERREVRRTSGSSGKPFLFERDRSMTARMDAAMWAVYGWYGVGPGDRMARFWGRPLSGRAALKRHVADWLLRQKRLHAFDVSPDRSEEFFRDLEDWDPTYAYGYPTLMQEFVEHLRASGEDGRELGLNVVITTGEMLSASARTSLREFFGCPVANEYGCSESGILSFECRAGAPHIVPVAAYPEIETRITQGDEEDVGRVLVTDLYGRSSPFIRYSLEDIGRHEPPSPCECGRELPRLEVLGGRTDSFIQTPDGRKIYDAILAYSVPRGVAQFRVAQTAIDELKGRVVVAEGFDPAEVIAACEQSWCSSVDGEIEVEVEPVSRIEPEESGKRRYFVPLDEVRSLEGGR